MEVHSRCTLHTAYGRYRAFAPIRYGRTSTRSRSIQKQKQKQKQKLGRRRTCVCPCSLLASLRFRLSRSAQQQYSLYSTITWWASIALPTLYYIGTVRLFVRHVVPDSRRAQIVAQVGMGSRRRREDATAAMRCDAMSMLRVAYMNDRVQASKGYREKEVLLSSFLLLLFFFFFFCLSCLAFIFIFIASISLGTMSMRMCSFTQTRVCAMGDKYLIPFTFLLPSFFFPFLVVRFSFISRSRWERIKPLFPECGGSFCLCSEPCARREPLLVTDRALDVLTRRAHGKVGILNNARDWAELLSAKREQRTSWRVREPRLGLAIDSNWDDA